MDYDGIGMWIVLLVGGGLLVAVAACGLFFAVGGSGLEGTAPAVLSERTLMKCSDLVDRLGEPVELELGGDYDGQSAQLQIAVKGSKTTGDYFFVTARSGKSWTVITADLTLEGDRFDVVTCRQLP